MHRRIEEWILDHMWEFVMGAWFLMGLVVGLLIGLFL